MPRTFSRVHRVESLIQAELAKIIEFSYHEKSSFMITVTGVKVTPDLSYAKVYVISHHDENAKEIIAFLNDEAKILRYELAKVIRLRKTPELHFYYDETIVRGNRISKLLNETNPS